MSSEAVSKILEFNQLLKQYIPDSELVNDLVRDFSKNLTRYENVPEAPLSGSGMSNEQLAVLIRAWANRLETEIKQLDQDSDGLQRFLAELRAAEMSLEGKGPVANES